MPPEVSEVINRWCGDKTLYMYLKIQNILFENRYLNKLEDRFQSFQSKEGWH